MTREEAKRRAELYSALAKGKSVQVQGIDGSWVDVDINKLNYFIEIPIFRIKPEPKYRPFKTQGECWEEMLRHQPFGWFRSKNNKNLFNTVCINDEYIKIVNTLTKYTDTYSDAFANIEFVDGTPFGIKEE